MSAKERWYRFRFAISHPGIRYYQRQLRRGGVECGPYVWICARPDVALGGKSTCTIGDSTFISTQIQIRGNDNGRIIVEKQCSIDTLARLSVANDAVLRIEEGVGVGPYNIINAFDDCTIGKDTMLSPYVNINCADHGMELGEPMKLQRGTYGPVVIGEDCWIGAGVVINKGVTIGKGVVVGAGAVVTCDLPPYAIAVGVPAKVIGDRRNKYGEES